MSQNDEKVSENVSFHSTDRYTRRDISVLPSTSSEYVTTQNDEGNQSCVSICMQARPREQMSENDARWHIDDPSTLACKADGAREIQIEHAGTQAQMSSLGFLQRM
jgi:hypothetical protein